MVSKNVCVTGVTDDKPKRIPKIPKKYQPTGHFKRSWTLFSTKKNDSFRIPLLMKVFQFCVHCFLCLLLTYQYRASPPTPILLYNVFKPLRHGTSCSSLRLAVWIMNLDDLKCPRTFETTCVGQRRRFSLSCFPTGHGGNDHRLNQVSHNEQTPSGGVLLFLL